ncbi:MAG: HNH endonuclease signature motif containing protein, partial [Marmoricola sp.]
VGGGWWSGFMPPTTTTMTAVAPVVVLDRAVAALAAQERAAVDLLVAAVDWAEAHVTSDPGDAAGWTDKKLYSEGVALLGGAGVPMIAEFAPLEFAGRLGWSIEAARQLIADGLELKHRLPRLWGLVLEQVVPVRVARHIATCTTDLTVEAVKQADRLVCADPQRVGKVKAEQLVDEIRLWFDPDRAADDEAKALATRGVWKHPGRNPATTEMTLILDSPDAYRFDKTVADIAAILKALGDTEDLDTRRARAVGILADPQTAVDLLHGEHSARSRLTSPTLFVHISEDSLARPGTTPAVIEKLGAVSTDLLGEWLSGSTVIVRPVLDLARADTVPDHDPPAWMRELVIQRDAHCVFPGCARDSRACDLDHIEPYDTGGPTTPTNLAPLCRRHHRAKTHADYHYQRHPDGTYQWTFPTNRRPLTP